MSFFADTAAHKALFPPGDHATGTQLKRNGHVSVERRVKLSAVLKSTCVMHANGIAVFSSDTFSLWDRFQDIYG